MAVSGFKITGRPLYGSKLTASIAKPKAAKPIVPRPVSQSLANPAAPDPLPVDATYDAQVAGAQRNRDTQLAGIAGGQQRDLLDYGYNATFDQSGGVAGLTFDATNPYSRAALLKKSYAQSRAGSEVSMASQGQLYSGAYQNAQDQSYDREGQASDALQKALYSRLAGYAQQRAQAGVDYETGASSALAARIDRAATNPLYTPTAPAAAPRPVPAKPVAKPAVKAAQPSAAALAKLAGAAAGKAVKKKK